MTQIVLLPQLLLGQWSFDLYRNGAPDGDAQLYDVVGLPDGGMLAVGTAELVGVDQASSSASAFAWRFNTDGSLVWEQQLDRPHLRDQASQVQVIGTEVYAVVSSLERESFESQTLLWKLDLESGQELSRTPLQNPNALDTLGSTTSFAVEGDAVTVVRPIERAWVRNLAYPVRALTYGLDGTYRSSFDLARFTFKALHWPDANRAILADTVVYTVDARGDTTQLPARDPRTAGYILPINSAVVSGNRVVYRAQQDTTGSADWLLLSSTDTGIVVGRRGLPAALAKHISYDFSAWGPDSFSVVLTASTFSIGSLHTFSMDGTYGRQLDVNSYELFRPGYAGASTIAVREVPQASFRRRQVVSKTQTSPAGIVDALSAGRIIDVPIITRSVAVAPGTAFLRLTEENNLLGIRSIYDNPKFTKLSKAAEELAVSPVALDLSVRRGTPWRFARLTGQGGYVLTFHDGGIRDSIFLLDENLALIQSYTPEITGSQPVTVIPDPRGGILIANTRGSEIVLTLMDSLGNVSDLDTVHIPDFDSSAYNYTLLNEISIGLSGDIALTGFIITTTTGTGFFIHLDGTGVISDVTCYHCPKYPLTPRHSPNGERLLVLNSDRDIEAYDISDSGEATYSNTLSLHSDALYISDLQFMNEDSFLISATRPRWDLRTTSADLDLISIVDEQVLTLHRIPYCETLPSLGFQKPSTVFQPVLFNQNRSAYVIGQFSGSSSLNSEFERISRLRVLNPATDFIEFYLTQPSPHAHEVDTELFDAAGRKYFSGRALRLSGDLYRVSLPQPFAAGMYVLRVGQESSLVIKQ